ATSSNFLQAVAYASVINKYSDNLQVDVVSAWQGSEAKMAAMRKSLVRWATQTSYTSICSGVFGIGPFEGQGPVDHVRLFAIDSSFAYFLAVRADSDIQSLADLDGEVFASGTAGSTAAVLIERACEIMGIHPEYFRGSAKDIVQAMQDRRVEGYFKAGAGGQVDATMMQIDATTPLRLLEIPKDVIDQLTTEFVGLTAYQAKKGSMVAFPEQGPIWTMASPMASVMIADMPQEVSYSAMKALNEHADMAAEIYIPIKDSLPDLAAFMVETLNNSTYPEGVPLHVGTYQYLREQGFDIPAKFIPPEWKG
ncbi:TAXI family TRAP transporter solute-binding subunit, partial [Chloroflexota bacterium]